MPKSTKVVFTRPRQVDFTEEEVAEPQAGQVLVKTLMTAVSTGTELTALTGDFPPASRWAGYVRYPFQPGYDHIGEVVAIGEAVEGLQSGDVVFSWAGHRQYALVDFKRAFKVPPDISMEEAAFATIGQITLNGVRLGEIGLGESVVIIGAGLLGQFSLQLARLCGGIPVIVVDLSERRLQIAKEHGADFIVAGEGEEVIEAVRQLTRGRMADVAYEITGNQYVLPWALKLLKRRGKLVLLGSTRGAVALDLHDEVHSLGLRIIGAHNSVHTPYETPFNQWTLERDLELFFDLLKSRRIRVKSLISHTFPWHKAKEAYQMLLKDRTQAMGVLFDWR